MSLLTCPLGSEGEKMGRWLSVRASAVNVLSVFHPPDACAAVARSLVVPRFSVLWISVSLRRRLIQCSVKYSA